MSSDCSKKCRESTCLSRRFKNGFAEHSEAHQGRLILGIEKFSLCLREWHQMAWNQELFTIAERDFDFLLCDFVQRNRVRGSREFAVEVRAAEKVARRIRLAASTCRNSSNPINCP